MTASRCRFAAADPDRHRCVNREGAPVNPGQVCWYEARTDFLEGVDATLDGVASALEARTQVIEARHVAESQLLKEWAGADVTVRAEAVLADHSHVRGDIGDTVPAPYCPHCFFGVHHLVACVHCALRGYWCPGSNRTRWDGITSSGPAYEDTGTEVA